MQLTIENLQVESFVTADMLADIALASWTRLPTCMPQYTCPECPDT